jgi:hypothetical protein
MNWVVILLEIGGEIEKTEISLWMESADGSQKISRKHRDGGL